MDRPPEELIIIKLHVILFHLINIIMAGVKFLWRVFVLVKAQAVLVT